MIVLISPCFKGALTSSCTFACAWCVCWTCVTSLLPSHYQALLWPSQTNQPLECTRVVANVSFLWTWESMSQGSWCAWDTVGRWHCSVWQWSGCTRLPVVWHCESEPQVDILERHYMLIINTVNIRTNVAWFSDGLRISRSHKGVRATEILGLSEDKVQMRCNMLKISLGDPGTEVVQSFGVVLLHQCDLDSNTLCHNTWLCPQDNWAALLTHFQSSVKSYYLRVIHPWWEPLVEK